MSTHSDAVYSKCPPARRWSGLSSASRRRLVTTRCSRGYNSGKGEAGRGKREAGSDSGSVSYFRAAIFGALLLSPASLAAQDAQPAANPRPEVVNLTLKGVKVVKQ